MWPDTYGFDITCAINDLLSNSIELSLPQNKKIIVPN